jgi:DNA mismatch repair protein MSH4
MMIDISAIQSLELIQNLRDARSKDCLYGLLNQTLTPMGARMLRNNILQPSTLVGASLTTRYDAVEELTTNEDMFTAARDALKGSMDVEELLPKVCVSTSFLSPDGGYLFDGETNSRSSSSGA